jgi:hypothetical protein
MLDREPLQIVPLTHFSTLRSPHLFRHDPVISVHTGSIDDTREETPSSIREERESKGGFGEVVSLLEEGGSRCDDGVEQCVYRRFSSVWENDERGRGGTYT